MRGNGDAMGVAGGLNDNADRTAPVMSFKPNAYGLYNMAGNVIGIRHPYLKYRHPAKDLVGP